MCSCSVVHSRSTYSAHSVLSCSQGLQATDRESLLALCSRTDLRHYEARPPHRWLLAAEHCANSLLSAVAGAAVVGFVQGQVGRRESAAFM